MATDYEKKYNEALERARKELGVDRKEWKVVEHVLRNIFPELAESEDERITRAINNVLPFIPDEAYANNGVTKECVLNWLEKQKEPEHICDSAQYEEGFKTGLEIGLRKQKEQKPVEKHDLVAQLREHFANTPKEQLEAEWKELEIMLNGFADDIVNNLKSSLPDNLDEEAEKVMPYSYDFIELDIYGGSEPVYSREQMRTMFKAGAEWMAKQMNNDN